MSGEVQLFRVELVEEGIAMRIHLNDAPIGPLVPGEHGPTVLAWFLGYLEERVQKTAARYGGGVVVRAEHVVPEGRCPECGKESGEPIEGVIENPCPVCRR